MKKKSGRSGGKPVSVAGMKGGAKVGGAKEGHGPEHGHSATPGSGTKPYPAHAGKWGTK